MSHALLSDEDSPSGNYEARFASSNTLLNQSTFASKGLSQLPAFQANPMLTTAAASPKSSPPTPSGSGASNGHYSTNLFTSQHQQPHQPQQQSHYSNQQQSQQVSLSSSSSAPLPYNLPPHQSTSYHSSYVRASASPRASAKTIERSPGDLTRRHYERSSPNSERRPLGLPPFATRPRSPVVERRNLPRTNLDDDEAQEDLSYMLNRALRLVPLAKLESTERAIPLIEDALRILSERYAAFTSAAAAATAAANVGTSASTVPSVLVAAAAGTGINLSSHGNSSRHPAHVPSGNGVASTSSSSSSSSSSVSSSSSSSSSSSLVPSSASSLSQVGLSADSATIPVSGGPPIPTSPSSRAAPLLLRKHTASNMSTSSSSSSSSSSSTVSSSSPVHASTCDTHSHQQSPLSPARALRIQTSSSSSFSGPSSSSIAAPHPTSISPPSSSFTNTSSLTTSSPSSPLSSASPSAKEPTPPAPAAAGSASSADVEEAPSKSPTTISEGEKGKEKQKVHENEKDGGSYSYAEKTLPNPYSTSSNSLSTHAAAAAPPPSLTVSITAPSVSASTSYTAPSSSSFSSASSSSTLFEPIVDPSQVRRHSQSSHALMQYHIDSPTAAGAGAGTFSTSPPHDPSHPHHSARATTTATMTTSPSADTTGLASAVTAPPPTFSSGGSSLRNLLETAYSALGRAAEEDRAKEAESAHESTERQHEDEGCEGIVHSKDGFLYDTVTGYTFPFTEIPQLDYSGTIYLHLLVKHHTSQPPVCFSDPTGELIAATSRDDAFRNISTLRSLLVSGQAQMSAIVNEYSQCDVASFNEGFISDVGKWYPALGTILQEMNLGVGYLSNIVETATGFHLFQRAQ